MNERLAFSFGKDRHDASAPARAAVALPEPTAAPTEGLPAEAKKDWAYLGLLIFTALLYFRPQDEIKPLAFLPLADIAALSALAAMVFGRINKGLSFTKVTPELIGVIGLAVVILLTVPFSIWPGGAVETFTDLYIKVLLIFMLMLNTLTSPARVRQFTWLIVIATAYIAFRAVFDYARGFNLIESGRVQGAVGGMFQNPNDLALNMVSVLPLSILLAMRAIKPSSRMVAVGSGFLMIGAVIASQSRSGSLGLAAMFVFLAWQVGRKRPSFIAALAVAVVIVLPLTPSSYWARMASITDEGQDDTGSREARRLLLNEAWQAFLDHPLTGVGAGQFKAYNPGGRTESWRETHNVVLQVASELGIFGLSAFMFLVYRAAFAGRATRRLLPRALGILPKSRWGTTPPRGPAVISIQDADFFEAYSATMAAAVAGWFLSALFASVAYNWTFYYLLALAIAPRIVLTDRLAAVPTPRRAAKRPAWQEAAV
ncbi:MAG: O-antigen ligase family protein [Acidobacteriota bacterium]|nr:O-antigen ligase family protein [Acidobacteriota bacterium]